MSEFLCEKFSREFKEHLESCPECQGKLSSAREQLLGTLDLFFGKFPGLGMMLSKVGGFGRGEIIPKVRELLNLIPGLKKIPEERSQ